MNDTEKPTKPTIVKLWFIDCPELYHRFRTAWEILQRNPAEAYPPIPVEVWTWKHATLNELTMHREKWQWFVMKPGVWFEMDNGEHTPLSMTQPDAIGMLASSLNAMKEAMKVG